MLRLGERARSTTHAQDIELGEGERNHVIRTKVVCEAALSLNDGAAGFDRAAVCVGHASGRATHAARPAAARNKPWRTAFVPGSQQRHII